MAAAVLLRRRNTSIGGAKVSIAMAVIGPTPGIVCRRRIVAPRLASHAIAFSSPATFSKARLSDRGIRAPI